MLRKILALSVSVLMLVTMFAAVPVSAEAVPESVLTDYTPGDDGNLITTYLTSGNLDINEGGVSATASGKIATVKATADFATSTATWGIKGFQINKLFNATWADAATKPDFAIGSKVLFAAKVRNAADSTAPAKVNNVYARTGNGTIIWPDKYPTENDGFTIPGTDWVDYKTTASVNQSFGTSRTPVFGLTLGTTTGTKVELDMSTMFYGEEKAYDIEVETDKLSVLADSEITAQAKIINQIDEIYSGAQGGFSWYALTEDRSAYADGITVTANDDNTATVTVAPTAAEGTYTIVAESDTYEGYVKGTVIEVISAADSELAEDGNLITKWPYDANPDSNSGSVSMSTSGDITTVKATADITKSTAWGLNGYIIASKFMETLPTFSAGDKLLFGAKVKMADTSETETGKINVVYQRIQSTYIWPDNYSTDEDGFLVSGTEWQDFYTIATVATATDYDDTYRYPVIGLPKGTTKGTAIALDMSTLFFGVEKPYNMTVTADETSAFTGEELVVSAAVTNQLGKNYSAGAGNIGWYAMNTDRTEVIDGITITENEDGTATVVADSTVAAGKYDIVAVSESYGNLVKGIEITVKTFDNFVPADDGNLITKWYTDDNPTGNSTNVQCGTSGTVVTLDAKANLASSIWGLHGFVVGTDFMEAIPTFSAGDKLLFGAKVRMADISETESGKINVVYQRTQSTYIWPDNYPTNADGLLVSGTEWQDFKTIATVKNATDYDDTYRYPVVGLTNGTTAGTAIDVDMSTLFFAVEKAYDINVTADETSAFAGEEITVSAEVTNQLDMPYSGGNGNFTWYAMNSDRTEVIDGITVTAGEDGTATVVADNTVAAGAYDIVATSDDYDGLVKGITIVVKTFDDYVPEKSDNGNLITKWPYDANPDSNSGLVTMSTSGNVTTVTAKSDITESTTWGLNGYIIASKFMETLPTFSAGDKLLFGAKVKMAGTSETESGKINVVYQRTQTSYIWPDKYSTDTDGILVSGTEWQDFKTITTIKNATDYDDTYRYPVIGLPKGTAAGTAISLDMSTLFFGVEEGYDITVTADETSVAAGSSIAVDADIVNQLYMKYSADNGDFSWYAMNTDRTEVIDGITVTAGEDGAATVAVDATVAEGTYTIVAMSDKFQGFVKGIDITVTEPADVIEGITITKTEGGITVATDEALEGAKLVFVKYDANGKMTVLDCTTSVTLDAQGTQEYTIPADFESAKAMLWTASLSAPLASAITY